MFRPHARALCLLSMLAFAAALPHAGAQPVESPAKALPADVTAFLERYEACLHWGGEWVEEEPRKSEVERAQAKLKCNDVEDDERKLRARHAASPTVLKALDRATSYGAD